MFSNHSRYAKLPPYSVPDRKGRIVQVVPAAPRPNQTLLGLHARKDGHRLDILAGRYLGDGTAFWRLCEMADVMLVEALTQADEIPIPKRSP